MEKNNLLNEMDMVSYQDVINEDVNQVYITKFNVYSSIIAYSLMNLKKYEGVRHELFVMGEELEKSENIGIYIDKDSFSQLFKCSESSKSKSYYIDKR